MTGNLGEVGLRRKRHSGDSMTIYDALPAPLRQWLSEAALPWSPVSARRIWVRALAMGQSEDEALSSLRRAEARTLKRERHVARGHPRPRHSRG